MSDAADKAVMVTGSSRGLGLHIARALLARGWRVMGVARSQAPGELRSDAYRHERLDLADPAHLRILVEELVPGLIPRSCRRLALVNNAGVLEPMGPLPELDADGLRRTMLVNLVAPMVLTGAFLRFDARLPIRIVDMSSGAATSPYPGWSAYCAGKSALRMAGQVLGTELEEMPTLEGRDVAIVSYSPHVVATRMQELIREMDEERFPRLQRFRDLHRRGELVDPAKPASEVCDILEADGLPPWSERRYTP